MLAAAKRTMLPVGLGERTLPAGLGRGLRMDIDFAHETRMFLGLYEIEISRHLRRMCTSGTRSFDVGAAEGFDSLVFAKLTGAAVASFEREEALMGRLRHTVGLNPTLAPLIAPVLATVGSGEMGSLALDEYAEHHFVPDFMKIDVEGAEADVLRGATRILQDRGPALLVEVHSAQLEQECGSIMVRWGYRPLVVSQRRLWPDTRGIAHNRWLVADARGRPAPG